MKDLEKTADDMSIALSLASHIDEPCTAQVDGKTENIRPFYIKMARDILPRLTNPYAIEFLESKIAEYK